MSSIPVRWGIVGAGRIAHSFARDIAAADGAELVAVAARDAFAGPCFRRPTPHRQLLR